MAKEDFCFTYYDGDAARDKAHLNRLERGAYDDLISAQRKFGHLTMQQIKKVLGSDFDKCWEALEWILIKDEGGKFYLEWVEKSVTQAKENSLKNSRNGSLGGRPPKEFYKFKKRIETNLSDVDLEFEIGFCRKKLIEAQGFSDDLSIRYYGFCEKFLVDLLNKENLIKAKLNPNESQSKGSINVNEDGNGNKDLERGAGENLLPLVYRMSQEFQQKNPGYPPRPSQDIPAIITIAEFIHQQITGKEKNLFEMDIGEQNYVFSEWVKWCQWYQVNGNNRSLETLVKFKLQEIFSEIKNGKKNGTHQGISSTKITKSAGANELLRQLKDELESNG